MFEYSPTKQHLLDLLGCDWKPQNAEGVTDPHTIFVALQNWKNDELYGKVPDDVLDKGIWPCSAELISAMRDALAEESGNYGSYELAYVLVRCGCRNADTIAGLNPIDKLVFNWSAKDLTADSLFEKFKRIGAVNSPNLDYLKQLDTWLADPGAALAVVSNPVYTLLADRRFIGYLYDNGCWPKYAELFARMAAHASPALIVHDVTQEDLGGQLKNITEDTHVAMGESFPDELRQLPILEAEQSFWKISFTFMERKEAIYITGDDTWLNDVGLAKEFNQILAKLNRKDRVIKLKDGRGSHAAWGDYVISEPEPFAALCGDLGIPLQPNFLQASA
jgi:hypothetical protein